MMVRSALAVLAVAAALVVLAAAGAASGGSSASRIVDRTLLCRAFGEGFPDAIRVMDASGAPRSGEDAPSASVYNGFQAEGVNAGFNTGPWYGRPTGAVWISRTTCSQTKLRVPLASSGLRGGPLPYAARYKCEVPARILARVRASFTRPVALRRDPTASYLSIAKGRITAASLAVTTVDGTPIVFASVDDATGKARLFTSRSRCSSA